MAAIASAAFILFISPWSASAKPRHVIGGHFIALAVAIPLALLANPDSVGWAGTSPFLFAVYAAVGVSASMFLMAATDTKHPPAASTALALIGHGFSWDLLIFVATAVLIMVGIHQSLRRHFADLY